MINSIKKDSLIKTNIATLSKELALITLLFNVFFVAFLFQYIGYYSISGLIFSSFLFCFEWRILLFFSLKRVEEFALVPKEQVTLDPETVDMLNHPTVEWMKVRLYPETIEWLIEEQKETGTPWKERACQIILDAMLKDSNKKLDVEKRVGPLRSKTKLPDALSTQ